MKTLINSFSGGKTSAYMTKRLMDEFSGKREIVNIFCNTGQEHEKTLEFVHNCDTYFGFNTIWLEAHVFHGERIGTSFKIVDFNTASRTGVPYEDVVKKYGIPNKNYPHCTRELKEQPFYSYIKSIGISDYEVAIGIRADEQRRISLSATSRGIIYPLVGWGITKQDVLGFWDEQQFNLGIEEREGNCLWCWKKSDKKHFHNMAANPEWYFFPETLEAMYAYRGAGDKTKPRNFFRGNRSTIQLKAAFEECRNNLIPILVDAHDDGCSESCEPFISDHDKIRNNTGE